MKKPKDYIIFPLDVDSYDKAMNLAEILNDHIGLFKIGLELFISQGPRIIKSIRNFGDAGIFLDLKLHDIPTTVKRAFMAACAYRPQFVTVYCDEGEALFSDVAADNPGNTKILAVTVLTSMNQDKLKGLGYSRMYSGDISALVLLRAKMAKAAGCHGVICSGHEVAMIKKEIGDDIIAVTPGIRPSWSLINQDDQKRIMSPADAVKNGADYIVTGRPVRDAKSPADAAKRIAEEIEKALE